jgi:hypothetical protein
MTMVARVPVDEISEAAREVRPGRTLLELVGFPFYLLGWLAFWLAVGTVRAVVWAAMAVKFGWMDARETAAARGMTMPVWPKGDTEDRRGVGTR